MKIYSKICKILLEVNQLEYRLPRLFHKDELTSFIYKERKKKFGKNSQIEGIIKPFENVLLVEDLMTDGGSKIKFIDQF